jgi:hypothetical protein
MSLRALATAIALPLLLAGCGDVPAPSGRSAEPSRSPALVCDGHASPARASVDLDGDGSPDEVTVDGAPVQGRCRDAVVAQVAGHEVVAALPGDLPVTSRDLAAVQIPGRTGDLLLLTARHPRGGFQATLYGYADGTLEQLTAEGKPIFDFIATDVLTTPTRVQCVDGGFDVTVARRHEPVGVVAACDVSRTVYTVDGNTVTRGATSPVAENVLDRQLQQQYGDLVDYSFFDNCRATA